MKVYLLEHHRIDGDADNYKTIGIFSSEVEANNAIGRLVNKPGFRESPNGFNLDCYEINKIFWGDGFGSV